MEALREKGYSWREVADFLTVRGVRTDHTRVDRHFGQKTGAKRMAETRPFEISLMTYLGQKPTKKKNAWNVLEIELASKLGAPITLNGFARGTGVPPFELNEGEEVSFREAALFCRSGRGRFPVAYLQAELEAEAGKWVSQEIYVVPD